MWTLLLGSLLLQPAPEPPPESVVGLPPLIVKATVEKDQLVSVTSTVSTVYVNVAVQRTVGGKVITEVRAVPETRTNKVKRVWDLKKAKITNGSGKKMDLDTLRKRLAVETPVVISADGKPISKGYLKLIRAEVIVIEAQPVAQPALDAVPLPPLKK